MKLQHLIVIFLVIMIPLVLVMSQYTSLQIDTLAKKTKYDTALLGATFDTMAAFELNTRNSKSSSVIGEEIRDLEAIVSTFTNSLSTSLNMTGVSDDYIMSYVPAIVFTLYDGYYIYSINSETGERELKPYVYYTKTYTNGLNTNITISYSLDNYVTIYGTYEGQKISAAGYLVVPGDVEISDDFIYATRAKEDGSVENYVVDPGGKSWVKYKGIKIEPEDIYQNETVVETRGIIKDQSEYTTESMLYYYEAAKFTEVYNKVVQTLNATDRTILKITETNNPEDEASLFMNEKINVIKDSITQNLNTAIYNYDGAVAENYEMPQLNGEDWDKILNNISIIAFLKNIPIGTTNYNNYVVVNSTTNQKYVSAKSIDFIPYDKDNSTTLGYYHNIICDTLIDNIKDGHKVVGYAASDFERYKYSPKDSNEYYQYYKHNEYADYDCQIKATERTNVSTIEEKLSTKGLTPDVENKVLKTYYTAVGRIRYGLIKASSYINTTDANINFKVKYDTNSGSWANGSSEQITVHSQYGKLRVNQEEPRKLGYKFLGWAVDSTDILPDIKTGDILYFDTNYELTLYAVYAQQYTVTYNANGGIGGPTPLQQTKTKDVDFIISKVEPTLENKVFLGWSTDQYSTIPDLTFAPGAIYKGNQSVTLYAVWADRVVTIEYYSYGQTYTQTKTIGVPINVWEPSPREGMKFLGWSTNKYKLIASEVKYALGSQYMQDTDTKLYAVWDEITYRIYFDANGGVPLQGDLVDPNECTKVHGFSYKIPNIIPIRESYEFKGWSTNRSDSVGEYQPNGMYDKDEITILYAIWEGEKYTVEYDANGGSNAPEKSAPILKSEDVTLTLDKPERTGYEFVGWSTDKYAKQSEVEYKPGDIYEGRTSVKLYAIWKKAVYKVIYIVDGNEFASQTKTYGMNINLTSQTPTKEGYICRGWSETNGGAINYLPGQIFKNDTLAQNGIISLYAVWTGKDDNVYMVNYLPNGGTFKQEDIEKGIDNEVIPQGKTTFKIIKEKPTREGYIFQGWSTDQNATQKDLRFEPDKDCSIDIIKEYGAKREMQEGSSIYSYTLSLYAVWKPMGITLTIDPDGTTWRGSTQIQTVQVSVDGEMEIEVPQRGNGYIYYWKVTKGDAIIENISFAGDGSIAKQRIVLGKQNTTIKPEIVEEFYKLKFSANSNDSSISGIPTEKRIQYNHSYTLPSSSPTRTGYTFKGWSSTSTGNVEYQAETNFTMPNHDVTLYAVWEIKTYQLTYNANGGQGAPTSENREYNSKLALSNTKPTRTGYTFKGWSNTKTGNVQYQPEASFTMPNHDVTLYAVWEIKTYQLIYNKNTTDTVSNLPDTEQREYNSSKALSTKTPTRTGYIFKGWSTENNVGSAEYQPGGNYGPMPASNVTLYAVWEPVVIERTGQFYMRNAESTSFIICIGWQQKYNKSTNSSTFTITKIQLKSTYGYKEYYPNGTIHINDDCVITMDNQGKNTNGNATHKFNTETTSAYYDITPMLDGQPSPPFAVDINHDTDGNNVEIELKNISFYNIFAAQSWLGPRGKVTIGQGGEVTIGQGGKEIIGENGEKIIEY